MRDCLQHPQKQGDKIKLQILDTVLLKNGGLQPEHWLYTDPDGNLTAQKLGQTESNTNYYTLQEVLHKILVLT